jgi:acyl carrier protein
MSEAPDFSVDTVRDGIIDHVLSNFVCPFTKDTIPLDQSLVELGVLDSYGMVELVSFLETNWSLAILDSEITKEKMGSINKMVALVREKLAVSPSD